MQKVKVASMAETLELPPYTQGYELVASVLKSIKANDCTRACIKLTRLVNIDTVMAVPEVDVFVRFVKFHTKTDRVSNKTYSRVLEKGLTALTVLRPKATRERRQVAALEAVLGELELRAVKHVRVQRSVIQNFDDVAATPLRNVNNPDALFLRSIKQTDNSALAYGESGLIKRAVTILHAQIPELDLREIKTPYGIRRISGMYLVASHARLVGASVEEGESLDDAAHIADKVLEHANRTARANGGEEYEFAPCEPVNCVHHFFWLLYPKSFIEKCRLAKFGSWDFVERPKPSNIQIVEED